MNIELMNKNRTVVLLEGEVSNMPETCFPMLNIWKITIVDKKFCPPILSNIEDEKSAKELFKKWIDRRSISLNRKKIKNNMNVDWKKNTKYDEYPRFSSLSDQYWFRYDIDGQTVKWEDFNFFTRKYNKSLGNMLISKMKYSGQIPLSYDSPDITTNGIHDKVWRQNDDASNESCLVKWSNSNAESISSEVLASEYLEKIKVIPFVKYMLTIDGYSICSTCKNFINEHQEFVPAWQIYDSYSLLHKEETEKIKVDSPENCIYIILMKAIEFFDIPNMDNFIDKMIIVDRQIMNFDRHLGNFGFIKNVETGEYEGPAPLFDFGSAFFPNEKSNNLDKWIFKYRAKELIKSGDIKPFNMNFDNHMMFTLPGFSTIRRNEKDFLAKEYIKKNIKENDLSIKRHTMLKEIEKEM